MPAVMVFGTVFAVAFAMLMKAVAAEKFLARRGLFGLEWSTKAEDPEQYWLAIVSLSLLSVVSGAFAVLNLMRLL